MNTTELEEKKAILLTFDVEDWFQVENFKDYISFSSWTSRELRVVKNTHVILDLLDSFSFKPKATFFILGWIAQKVPELIREIKARGHEIASHGNQHHLCTKQNSKEIISDLEASKKLLEDTIGDKIYGYRAPSFAVDDDVLEMIKETGHIYDSSYNSFSAHERYGKINLSNKRKMGVAFEFSDNFFELPISNLGVGKRKLPLGGGGYFRLLPFFLFKLGMDSVLKKEGSFVFYSHPWEFDPEQPKVESIKAGFKFRHYVNLDKTEKRLSFLVQSFKNLEFLSCADYLRKRKLIPE